MIPLVLAGGLGTRARPLTVNRPKPLLPVANRPLIEHVLLHLRGCGFRRAEVLTHHDAEKVRDAVGDGAALGVRVSYRHEERDRGTAGAAANSVAASGARTALVVSADVLCSFDLRALVATHRARHARASIAVTRVANPLQFGILVLDRHGRVRRFLEKPTWGEVFSDSVNAGVFVLERSVLAQALGEGPIDFAADLFPLLLADGVPLHGIEAEGYWRDVGDPESYLAAHTDFFRGVLPIEPPGRPSETATAMIWQGAGVVVETGAELRGRIVLGDGCRIGPGARLEDVVLGDGTSVAAGADLRQAVAWRAVRVGDHARVEGAVLCERVEIGPRTVIEAGAIVGDGTRLGREVRVKEGVRIWPAKVIEDHAVVHSNLVHAARWRTSAFEEGAVSGLTNLELTPEVAARLGAAYGTLLAPGSTALSVRDAHPASRMLRRSFFGGVGSTGVHMVDLGLLPVPVMRHKLESFGEQGGVSFQQVPQLRGMTSIRFFDGDGLDISTGSSKSIERVFLREEFRRVQHEEIGAIFELPRILDFYAEAFLKALDVGAIRSRRLRLVVDYSHSAAVVVLPRLLGELGCDVVTLNAHLERHSGAVADGDPEVDRQRLAAIVRSLGADLGVWLHPSGERLALA
ncbi:MAG: sugar phosphate nucleotidyltransferase, partial [Acidobacteriota bacterium]